MNRELAALLQQAGVPGEHDWDDMVVLFNYAPVPPALGRRDQPNWNRGFNITLLLKGEPTFFAKCRPTSDTVIRRETLIRSSLAGNRRHGLSIAPVYLASSEHMAVQVSPFLNGPHYGRVVASQSTAEYLRTLRTVLYGIAKLSGIAVRECSWLRSPASSIGLAEALADRLADVAALATLTSAEHGALAAVLEEAGTVPSRPQHGDFWWQNILLVDGRLWAIDFDSFGDVLVPLYDDLTLMFTTIAMRSGAGVAGLERLMSTDVDARACRELLSERAIAENLAAAQMDGVLAYYLTQLASTVHGRGGPAFSRPHMAAVKHVAQRFAAGERGLLIGR